MRNSNDIASALWALLAADGKSASAHVLPATLGAALPHVHVERTGGFTEQLVIESNQVDFDVYADDMADAMDEAHALCGWVRSLSGQDVGTPCYGSEVTTLPYANPDPRHPTLARATFKANIETRVDD